MEKKEEAEEAAERHRTSLLCEGIDTNPETEIRQRNATGSGVQSVIFMLIFINI